ncbi:unnamed protein product [Owenia fusiformis]|uniref:Uncharacterized protein n=1 Tax=Owenia fusiformis TaxID=6347 RepID=A0A8J1U690_OWEFU|nr:unnamed protein product [Owenia fusiformis]
MASDHGGPQQGTMPLDTSNAIVNQPLGHHEQVGSTPDDIIIRTSSDTPEHESTTGTTLSDVNVVRAMEEDDADFAGRMEVESFRSKYECAVGKNRMEECTVIRQNNYRDTDDKNCRIFIAEYKNKRAGMLFLKFHGYKGRSSSTCDLYDRLGCRSTHGMLWYICLENAASIDPVECYIECICVDKEHRGKGIGKILMERAEQEAKAIGCSKMTLHVAQSNRAISLYQRQGYHIAKDIDGCCCVWCIVGIRKWYTMSKMI